MKSEDIFGTAVFLSVAALMIGIGIYQYRSKKPVTFYTGEEPLPEDRYTDVSGWNKAHGRMWMVYGILIMAGSGAALMIGSETPLCMVPYLAGVLLPLPGMILIHKKLSDKYIK